MLEEYKEQKWDPNHKLALAEALRKLQAFEAKNPSLTGNDKLIKDDLETQVEVLNSLEKKYKNIGPCLDCIVFNDGEKWRACLDTTFEGNLAECQVLGVYRETFDVGTLSQEDQLSYTINIHEDGNVLEIVSMCCKLKSLSFLCFLFGNRIAILLQPVTVRTSRRSLLPISPKNPTGMVSHQVHKSFR
jgi:tripeptidyl-peptidase-2